MATTTENFLGKCKEKGCDYVIFATGADVRQAENFREVRAGAGVFKVGNNGRFARCTNGHKFFAVKAVKGTYSPDHKCDSRCLNARGWSCTCSCGGANHGRGHVGTIVQASSLKTTDDHGAPLGGWLGEVGKHIRGEVMVARVNDLGDKTLYTFTTEAGHTIKWFVPKNYDPGYLTRQTLTIRAKVKAHEDHPQFGKSTVVIYVEEVE